MNLGHLAALLLIATAPASAAAADYLEKVQSPIYEVEGTRAELAKRAAVCAAKTLPAQAGVQTIQANDPESGMVIATAVFSYSQMAIPWTVRSTLTIETKDGRFRLTHTGLQQRQGAEAPKGFVLNNPRDNDWMAVGTWWGSGHTKVSEAANAISEKLALCIKQPLEDW